MTNNKPKKVFVSHSSKDVSYVQKIIELFEDIGLTENDVVCSSVPGYGIPLGEDIYDWLATQFRDFDLHVLFILSKNYYDSVACQNEMGAAWVLQKKHDAILLPGFEYENIKGAVNPRQISIKLDGDEDFLKQHLNELKDSLVQEFGLTMPSASKWERNRTSFLESISSISTEAISADDNSLEIAPVKNRITLTQDAAELLLYAAKDPSGRVQATKMLRGVAIVTNARPFCSPGTGHREEARWMGALEELESYDLLQAVSFKREVFTVTREGYAFADELEKKRNLQIAPVRSDIESFL